MTMTETTSEPRVPGRERLGCAGFIKQDRIRMVQKLNEHLPEGWEAVEQSGIWLLEGDLPRACNWDRYIVWFNGLPAKDFTTEAATVLKTQQETRGWQASMQSAFMAVAEGRVDESGQMLDVQ